MTKKEQMKWAETLHGLAMHHAESVRRTKLPPWTEQSNDWREIYRLSVRDLIAAYEKSKKSEPSHD